MKIKNFVIPVIVVVILIIGVGSYIVYSLNNDAPESSKEMISYTEEMVKEYLIQEKGYSESEILKIVSERKAKSSDFSASGYEIEVVFSDEPKAIYFYQLIEDKVEQFGVTGPAIKHKELP